MVIFLSLKTSARGFSFPAAGRGSREMKEVRAGFAGPLSPEDCGYGLS